MHVAAVIQDKLQAAFAPVALEVVDQSHLHAGHMGTIRTDGGQGETHFHVRIVSAAFDGTSRVERQRRVYAVLADELKSPVHALSLAALTPAEAEKTIT